METLSQPPEPHTFYCEREGCGQPIDFWDWACTRQDETGLPPLCINHAVDLLDAPPAEREAYHRWIQWINRYVRQQVGIPSGTLIRSPEDFGNRNKGARVPTRFVGDVYAVAVDAWDKSWPQYCAPWPGYSAMFVVLAGFVRPGLDIEAGWLIYSSWQQPDAVATCAMLPPDFVPTKAEERRLFAARGTFFQLRPRSGRPKGSGARFETRDDALAAMRNAITALCKKQGRVSRAAIGRQIGRTYRKSLPSDDGLLADPGKQIDRWEEEFDIDVDALIHEICP